MSLCFLKAFTEAKNGSLSQRDYIIEILSHLKGVRHADDAITSTIEPLALFEPWAASLRDLALGTDYAPLDNTSEYETLFWTCFEGRANRFKSDLRALRKDSDKPDPLQPAACLAAQQKHLKILQICLEEGAVFDRYLTRAAQIGARGNIDFLHFLLGFNWAGVRDSREAVEEQIKHYGDDSKEAEWLRENAGRGPPQDEEKESSSKSAGDGRQTGKEKKSKNPSNYDPNQGLTPEQIQEAFGDVPW